MSNEKKEVCIYIDCVCNTGFVGATHRETVEVWVFEDDNEKAIEDKCEEVAREWLHGNIDFSWSLADEKE